MKMPTSQSFPKRHRFAKELNMRGFSGVIHRDKTKRHEHWNRRHQ